MSPVDDYLMSINLAMLLIIRDFQVKYDVYFSFTFQKIIKIVDGCLQSFFELYFWLPTESFFS